MALLSVFLLANVNFILIRLQPLQKVSQSRKLITFMINKILVVKKVLSSFVNFTNLDTIKLPQLLIKTYL